MASLKNVRMKIAGVKKTKQITKAMNMVSSAKLRGAVGPHPASGKARARRAHHVQKL